MHKATIVGIAIEVIGNGVGVGLQMTGITYPIVGWIIIGVSIIAGIILIYYGISKKKQRGKSAMGLLIGRSTGGKVINCHASGKITIHGKPEDVDAGSLIGQSENTEVVGSSADAEIEYKQD
jgi:membrane-bound ClpP family serine protease